MSADTWTHKKFYSTGTYLLRVSVPVLSEQSTSIPDISSKQLNLHVDLLALAAQTDAVI